jgi:hypothetical protein
MSLSAARPDGRRGPYADAHAAVVARSLAAEVGWICSGAKPLRQLSQPARCSDCGGIRLDGSHVALICARRSKFGPSAAYAVFAFIADTQEIDMDTAWRECLHRRPQLT